MLLSLDTLCAVRDIPAELYTAIVSILPVTESRIGIPVGKCLGLPLWESFLIGVVSNIIGAYLFLLCLPLVIQVMKKIHPKVRVWIEKFLHKTQEKHTKKFRLYGSLMLTIFVAVPIPGTGAYTGALLAYIFGIGKRTSFLTLSLGILIAAGIVTLVTAGLITAF